VIGFTIQTPKGKQRITSPASWRELTIQQLIELETEWDGVNPIVLFSIVTGLDVGLLKNSDQEGLEEKMLAICAFAYDQPQWDALPKPKHIEIGGEVYKTPDTINRKLLGQKIMVSQIAIKESADLISQIPRIVAIYMQAVIDGEFKDERMEEVEALVRKSPAMDCYGLGKFFFQKSVNLMNIGAVSLEESPSRTIPIKKLLKGLQRLKDSAPTQTSA